MICKTCGTEIADKALICYRCGNSTFEPARRERAGRRHAVNLLPSLLALIVLVVAALLMGRAAVGEVPRTISVVLAVMAAVVFAWQLVRRRRRGR
ncbi:MAG: hypothetical protein ACM3NQ_24250 [Bacteroidales bacterium]